MAMADVRLGHELGTQQRTAPGREQIAAFMVAANFTEPMFTDVGFARAIGYRDTIVPGPLLAALLEQFLHTELPGWELERLSTTFRVATIAGDTLTFTGVVTEHHETPSGHRLVCDLVIGHSDAEQAVISTATLRRAGGA